MLKQIILIRHAKVDIDSSQKIDSVFLQKWVEEYDSAPICRDSLPTQETRYLVSQANILVTSTLRRAIDSANVLGIEIYECNILFNEATIPNVNIPFFILKPKTWLVILRLLLLLGLGKKDATFKTSKIQAQNASDTLKALADEHGCVVLVGHGGMNWLIRKALLQDGWALESKVSNSNWGVTHLTYSDT